MCVYNAVRCICLSVNVKRDEGVQSFLEMDIGTWGGEEAGGSSKQRGDR